MDQTGTSLVVYCPLVLLERGEGVCGSDRDQFGCLLSTSTIRKRGGCVWISINQYCVLYIVGL